MRPSLFLFPPAAAYLPARISRLGFSLLFLTCALQAGCSQWMPAAQPAAAPVPTTLPAFVYPSEPPVVSAEALRSWIIRLDSAKTAIWVFDASSASAETARLVAAYRDALRSRRSALIGLYTGAPSDWGSRVVPLLRSADANFPCAVVEPGQGPGIGVWLASQPSGPPPGLYVLSAERRVVARATDDASLRSLLEGMAGTTPSTRPADVRPRWLARVRIVELASGRVLARAEAQADDPSRLARLISGELTRSLASPPPLAIAPLRQIGPAERESHDQSLLFSEQLGRELAAAGWQNLIPVQTVGETLKTLGRGPLSAEFDPGELSTQTHWQALLVGTMAVNAPPG
jgi:hypothetical protein